MLDQSKVVLYELMTMILVSINYVFFYYKLNDEEEKYNLLEKKYKELEKKLLHYELMEFHKKKYKIE
jgi:hypothetical protein